jgi:hypothetical protein
MALQAFSSAVSELPLIRRDPCSYISPRSAGDENLVTMVLDSHRSVITVTVGSSKSRLRTMRLDPDDNRRMARLISPKTRLAVVTGRAGPEPSSCSPAREPGADLLIGHRDGRKPSRRPIFGISPEQTDAPGLRAALKSAASRNGSVNPMAWLTPIFSMRVTAGNYLVRRCTIAV